MKIACPLCADQHLKKFFEKRERIYGQRSYFECGKCRLVFLDPKQRLSPDREKKIYLQHENSPDHEGYVAFLSQLTEPLNRRLKPGSCGLDFGSGPGPTLSVLMNRNGHKTLNYDPIFNNRKNLLNKTYDFVCCTEVIEHVFEPEKTFRLLTNLMKPDGGLLGVMTQILHPDIDFEGWWYHRDPTHVCFYRPETVGYIAEKFAIDCEWIQHNVLIFRRDS